MGGQAWGSNPIVPVLRSKRSALSDSEQQRTLLQLSQGPPWMAGWLRNPHRRGSDHDAYDGAQDSPPAGLSATLDQRPVSPPTPVSPTVAQHPTITDAETIEPAPISPNPKFMPLAHSTPIAESVPPAPETSAPALDQDITTCPGPPPSPAHNTHETPTAAAKAPKRRQMAVKEAPGLPATDCLSCGFSFPFSLPLCLSKLRSLDVEFSPSDFLG